MTLQHQNIELKARSLGAALPPLVVQAERLAATVMMGTHGLRRAGPGESFWAYRTYGFGDSVQRIDWRKSAKTDEHFIRENEWEAANTLWLWAGQSQRMNFKSHLATETKAHHAAVLGLATSALALRAHERVGLLQAGERATYGRHVLVDLARKLALTAGPELPRPSAMQRRSTGLLISDFLEELQDIETSFSTLAETGMRGHVVQIIDPAEATLPYAGRVEFLGLDTAKRFRAPKVESLRADYQQAFGDHSEGLRNVARRLGFTFTRHRTDQPLTKVLLALHQVMAAR